jgi:HK97 gp10 family phage protein
MADIIIKGMEELFAKLSKLELIVDEDIFDGVDNLLESDAKSLCPVRSGNLQSSIHSEVTVDGNDVVLTLGADAEYASFVELGTSKMAAQPFLYPAMKQNERVIESTVAEYLLQQIKEVIR